jgi:hypothetical protein
MQRFQDQRNLDAMLRVQKGQAPDLEDSIAKTAKRALFFLFYKLDTYSIL